MCHPGFRKSPRQSSWLSSSTRCECLLEAQSSSTGGSRRMSTTWLWQLLQESLYNDESTTPSAAYTPVLNPRRGSRHPHRHLQSGEAAKSYLPPGTAFPNASVSAAEAESAHRIANFAVRGCHTSSSATGVRLLPGNQSGNAFCGVPVPQGRDFSV